MREAKNGRIMGDEKRDKHPKSLKRRGCRKGETMGVHIESETKSRVVCRRDVLDVRLLLSGCVMFKSRYVLLTAVLAIVTCLSESLNK